MSTKSAAPQLYTYATAPEHPRLAAYGVTTRQLKRWVERQKVEHEKVANRVYFTEAQIEALADSFTVKAVR